MARNRGTGEGNYHIEIDGIADFHAIAVSGGVESIAVATIPDGIEREEKVRNTVSVEDLTIRVAVGKHEVAMAQIRDWYRDCRDGNVMVRRNIRRVLLEETGRTPINTIEYLECWPRQVSMDDQTKRGDGGAMVTIIFACESVEW